MRYGFTVHNWKARLLRKMGVPVPSEDSFSYQDGVFSAAADGVTRDFSNGDAFEKNLDGVRKLRQGLYPDPSPAKENADLFTRFFPVYLDDFHTKDAKALFSATSECNKKMCRELPGDFEVDYLANDYPGCTAAATVLRKEEGQRVLSWGFISDCRIVVIHPGKDYAFITDDEGPHGEKKKAYLDGIVSENGGWNNPEARKTIRKYYRNRPEARHSFGVLTGETKAMAYFVTGEHKVNPGDYVLVFSDGLTKCIFPKNDWVVGDKFLNVLKQDNPDKLKRYCQRRVFSEGTLVVSKVD